MLAVVFAPVVAGLLTLLLPTGLVRRSTLPAVLLAAAGPAVSLWSLVAFHRLHGAGGRVAAAWMPALHLDWAFLPDALGLFFAALIAGIGLLIILYGRAYFGPDAAALRRFFPLITLFMTAMLGLVLADDFLLMLVFWELTSISSFLLIGWDTSDRKAVGNALQAFVTTGTGGLAMLGGLVWLGVATGAWSFTALDPQSGGAAIVAAFVLIYLGIAAKSAQWPLHYWLPGAMLAPTPISAYLHSAAMVKAGIYLLARLWPTMSGLEIWPPLVVGIGGITMLLGAFIALQRDALKQILAYTTISQLGLLAAAFGLAAWTHDGEANIVWGNAQILNHALYKAPLFMLAGGVAHALSKATLSELRGAWRLGGWWGGPRGYALLFLLAMIALAALPGTFSFFAKEAFLYGIWHAIEASGHWALWLLLVAAVLTSTFNVALLVRFATTFFAKPPSLHVESQPELEQHDEGAAHHHEPHHHDGPAWASLLWLPAAALIALQWFGGLFGTTFARLLLPLEATPHYWSAESFDLLHLLGHPGVPLVASGIGIVLGLLLGFSPLLRGVRQDPHDALFPAALAGSVNFGRRVFGAVQNGRITWYVACSALGLVALVAWTGYVSRTSFVWPGDFALPSFTRYPAAWLLCLLVCGGAIIMTVVRERITRVLVLGAVGFSVTGVFYVYAAPDLALTQLSIEIVSLILFLLVLDLLPSQRERVERLVPVRLGVALAVGITATFLTLWAASGPRPQRPPLLAGGQATSTLGEYFLRDSYQGRDTASVDPALLGEGVVDRGAHHLESFGTHYEGEVRPGDVTLHKGGGGANVVNVILVDFRGFDTMGEITVLGLAAMGVWTLLRPPVARGATDNRSLPYDDTYDQPGTHQPRGRAPIQSHLIASPILRNAVKVLIPLAVVFGAYLFFKGHQSPGGGFVAGLATAAAMLVYRMCFGARALYALTPFRERTLIALGLLLAAGTTAAPLLWGLPLLTSNNGYLPLPGGQSFHWATVMVFDAGRFLVVVGSVVGMIDAIARELE